LAPEWLLHVSTVSSRLTPNSLHLIKLETFIEHNTAPKAILEQKLTIYYILNHLPLPDIDNNNRKNHVCIHIQRQATNKSKTTLRFNDFSERDPESHFYVHKKRVTYALRTGCPADVGFAKVSSANLSSP
jgi:hypothetical protein